MVEKTYLPRAKGWLTASIWALRLIIGAVFVISGFAKMDDLYGFIFKIEEYLAVWGWQQPRSIVHLTAMGIAGWEFLLGLMLALGCYKRFAPWGLLATMVVMLPLTAYLAVADPVEDCGCFGDLFKMSNVATFLKNVALTAGLIVLVWGNGKVKSGVFQPAIQWLIAVWAGLYIVIVGLYGYNVQPMLDFRSYSVGTQLDPEETDLAIFDSDGEDVTAEVIHAQGTQWLLVIPEIQRADISYTYYINELAAYADSCHIPFVGLMGVGPKGLTAWKDVSMAEYPLFTVDETQLKELSRGNLSLVVLHNSVIASKTSASAMDPEELESSIQAGNPEEAITSYPKETFTYLTWLFGCVLAGLVIFQGLVIALTKKIGWKKVKREEKEEKRKNS